MGRSIPVQLGKQNFDRKSDALQFMRSMLQRYSPGERVASDDEEVLRALLQRHPEAANKIQDGVDHFVVRSADYGTKCFWVVRTTGSTEKFSYVSCIY